MGQPFTQIARMYVCSRREFIAGHTALLVKGLVESESVAHTDHRYTRGTTKVIEHLPDELNSACLHRRSSDHSPYYLLATPGCTDPSGADGVIRIPPVGPPTRGGGAGALPWMRATPVAAQSEMILPEVGAAASITPNASIVLCALSMCFPRMTMFTLRVGAARQATLSDTRKYYLAHR